MKELNEQPIKVYVKVNQDNFITEVNSEIFINDLTGWTYIDSGFGDKYAHAQSQYFDKTLMDENGNYNYKFINGEIIKNLLI